MPRARSNKNRRGGGRTDSIGTVKEDTVVEIDLDSNNMSLDSSSMNVDSSNMNVNRIDVDLDSSNINLESSNTNLDITNMDLDSNNTNLETSIINVGVCENDQSQNAHTPVKLTDHEIISSKTEITAQALQCSGGREENKVDIEENSVIDLDQENKIESEVAAVERCLETLDKLNCIEENPSSKSIHQEDGNHEAEGIVDNIVNLPLTEQAQENQLETPPESSSNKDTDAEMNVLKDHKEDDGLQNIDRKTNEDHKIDQSIDVSENASKGKTNEQEKTDNTVCADIINKPFSAGQSESHDVEELENNKFEEISEGSIEQAEQDDLIAESLSDVEITGESFDPLKVQNNRNNAKGKNRVMYKKPQSLGAAYFTAKNNKVNSAAESRENDDISDDSLSDHIDLSLEEISDDELEPSKKRRKSLGQASTKTGSEVKTSSNNKQDKENTSRSDDMYEIAWKDRANVKAQKHAAIDNVGVTNPSSSKRMKLDDKNDIEEVSSSGEQDPTFSADKDVDLKNEAERFETKGLDISYNRNIVLSSRNPSQSSTNWRQHNTERSLESRDSVAPKRKYEMVDSSCQSEPRVLKGKIVQCNINPVKPNHKLDKQERYDESAIKILELFSKFRHTLSSKIPDTIASDVCSLQPSQRIGVYSVSMGPLILSDTQSPVFKNILSDTESFSLVFADQCHGVFKATFAKCGSITSLLTWLSHQGLKSHSMVVSVLYNGEGSVWKAVFLHLGKTSVQAENQIVSEGGGKGVQLYLQGMPSGVSTAFIHLLFPGAQNVVPHPGTSSGTVTLAYSNSKMAEAVLSSYGLLVINGSQINIACLRSLDGKESVNTFAEAVNETEALSKKLSEHGEQFERCDKVSEDVAQVADYNDLKIESKAHVDVTNKFGSNGSQQKPTASNTDEEAGELGKPVGSSTLGSVKNLNKVFPNIESDVSLVCDTDSILTLTDNVDEKSALLQAKDALLQAKGALLQAKDANVERTELMDKPTEIMEVDKIAVQDSEPMKLRNQTEGEITFHSAHHFVEVGTVAGKDQSCNLGVAKDADKLEVSVHDKTSDNESHTHKNTATLERDVEMYVQEVDCVISEGNILHIAIDCGGCGTSNKGAGEIEARKEILEDVSDDEVTNQKKHESLDAAIVVGDSPKQVDTNASFPPASVVSYGTDNTEDSAGLGRKKAGHSESVNSMLVMTDGALEVVMEVVNVDDYQVEKVIFPSTRHMSPVFYSSYASKSAMLPRQQDRYKKPSTGGNTSVSSKHYYSWSRKRSPSPSEMLREPEAHRRDSSPPRRRSRSPSPRRYSHGHYHGYKRYESPPPGRSGNSTRIEFNSREQGKVKTSEYSTHRDPHRSDRRHSYREHRPLSLSRRSESPQSHESAPHRHKSPYRRDSPKHPVMHTSRSPISISSRSHSLSPVSKSSSVDPLHPAVEKDELAKTVEHILKLAKDLHHTKKRQSFRPKSSRRSSSRYSPHFSRSSHTKHSRSPQRALSRSSRSPTYARSSRYRYKRTPSPSSHRGHKRHYGECSSSIRKSEAYPKESGSSRYFEREKPSKSGDYSYDEPSGRSKSGKWPIEPYRTPIDQLGQQSYGGYQSQSCGQVPANNIYSPSFPPPGMYPGSSMPVYQYNNSQSQYSYSNVPPGVPPPTYMPNVPPPATPHSFTQPYQQAYPMYPPRF